MSDDLLRDAHTEAENAAPSMRAAAYLRIARVESGTDTARARRTLLQALDVIRSLPDSNRPENAREQLLAEARGVAVAISPELLAEIPLGRRNGHERFASINTTQVMLAHGHVDAAYNYVLWHDAASFPFMSIGGVLYRLDPQSPEAAARRTTLVRRAVEVWQHDFSGQHSHERDQFVQLFGQFWKELPAVEALAVSRAIVDRAMKAPDTETSAGYANELRFSSTRQSTFFQILHVLRHLDPELAKSLINSHDQLAAGARRYPNGMETLHEEAAAEAERPKADGATCGGGYILAGDPRDFDRQRRLMDATRNGDFEPSLEDALEKYREDTGPDTRNYAPKEYWPSTGAFRRVLYQAGKRLGGEATSLLQRIQDDHLRLFAAIELAAALTGVPESSITQMKQPNPPGDPKPDGGRIIATRSGQAVFSGATGSPEMRSPDGRLIRCPECSFQPPEDTRWVCKCGHIWNTFWTSGLCPACHFQGEVTSCHRCHEMSQHKAWYVADPPVSPEGRPLSIAEDHSISDSVTRDGEG